eukprot:TRINITY_DN807_c0_g1_i1.p1 TRINITY_DN807_c0_g1~~TRINITY_DN807_c0_g1_i1.p1  ORF type:complete len:868 (+),score=187.73 TRINITY_DN807_c0_g1_i1:100-2703(+)
MGFREKVEILVTYCQFLGLIVALDAPFPSLFSSVLGWTKFLAVTLKIPWIPSLDFRAQFTIVAVILPLIFTLILLLVFKDWTVVVWYVFLLVGLTLVLAGIIPRYTMSNDDLSTNHPNDQFLYTGLIILGICLILLLFHLCCRGKARRSDRINVAGMTAEELQSALKAAPRPSFFMLLFKFLVGSLLILLGLATLGFIPFTMTEESQSSVWKDMNDTVAWFLVVLGALVLIHFVLTLSKKGREKLFAMRLALRGNFLKLVLFLLTILYLPVITNVFDALFYVRVKCSEGHDFPNRNIEKGLSPHQHEEGQSICRTCSFIGTCNLMADVCPAETDYRLVRDDTLSVPIDILPFFTPAAVLMFIAFVVGLPFLFYQLIKKSTVILEQLPTTHEEGEIDKAWEERTALTKSSSKMLFASFERRYRFYKLIQLFQKLLLVAVFVFFVEEVYAAIVLMALIHLIFFLTNASTTPFINFVEDILASVVYLCSFLTACFALYAIEKDGSVQWEIVVLIVVMDGVLPLLVLCLAPLFLKRRQSQKQKEREENIRLALERSHAAYSAGGGYYAVNFYQQYEWEMQHSQLLGGWNSYDPRVYPMYPMSNAHPQPPMQGGGGYEYAQPGYAQPGYAQPGYAQPGYAQPGNEQGYGGDGGRSWGTVPVTPQPQPQPQHYHQGSSGMVVPMPVAGQGQRQEDAEAEEEGTLTEKEKEIFRSNLQLLAIDRRINRVVLNIMTMFFLIVGIIAFIALGFCLIGIFFATNPDFIPGRPLRSGDCDYHRRFEFAEYDSWTEFTTNCCCREGKKYDDYSRLELWYCENGRYKERIREEDGEDGFSIRPMCSKTFTVGVTGPTCVDDDYVVYTSFSSTSFQRESLW